MSRRSPSLISQDVAIAALALLAIAGTATMIAGSLLMSMSISLTGLAVLLPSATFLTFALAGGSPPASSVGKKKGLSAKSQAAEIKSKQAKQLAAFEKWAAQGQWSRFHSAHYDWWMFPINRNSQGQGSTYRAGPKVVAALRADRQFMKDYRRGVSLVCRSWGWDLRAGRQVQSGLWRHNPVRVGKMLDSLKNFGQHRLHARVASCIRANARPTSLPAWVQKALSPSR